MNKKILMIYPEIPATYWSFKYSLDYVGAKANFPPLGLLTVAALLPSDYTAKLIDMNVEPLEEKDIIDADLIFISAMIVQKDSFEYAVKLCSKFNKKIVAGGPYTSSSYDHIEGVDHFIINESEEILHEFLHDYENGNPKKIYQSAHYPDIRMTPVPAFNLIKLSNYYSMTLQFSRGCPFNCEFCDIIEMFGRKPRTKDTAQFINEMQNIYDYGFRGSLFIVDDNFIGNKNRSKELLSEIVLWQKKNNFPFVLYTEASINLADDDELMELMVNAGFNMVFIGIETPVEESLAETHKNQNLKGSLLEKVWKVQRKGLEVTGGFIVGFDSDPENIFDLQFDFIQKSGINTAMIGLLMALPNTQLYRRLKSENRLISESTGNNTHALDLNFITKMDREKLISGYKQLMGDLYLPINYFKRCDTLLSHLPLNKFAVRDLNYTEIRAFLLSLYRLTFSSYGLIYLKFLLRTTIRKPRVFPEAVRMAIMGSHLIKITKEILALESLKGYMHDQLFLLDENVKNAGIYNPGKIHRIFSLISRSKAKATKMFNNLDPDFQLMIADICFDFNKSLFKIKTEIDKLLKARNINKALLHHSRSLMTFLQPR